VARRVGQAALSQRVLMFVAVLGVSSTVAVVAAHQERFDAGFGILMVGVAAIGGLLWLVAWWRGAWRLSHGYNALAVSLAGLAAVTAAGSTAVSEVVLAARGELVDVSLVELDVDPDQHHRYALVPVTESAPVYGDLHTKQVFPHGQPVAVLVDRSEFVRPMLPEDMDTVGFVLITLAGIGLLAGGMIGFGFPLGAGRRAQTEQNSPP
jgi:hypothetical protein